MRQQIKWVAFAASLVGVAYLSVVVVGFFFTTEAAWGSEGTPLLVSALQNVVLLSYAGVPEPQFIADSSLLVRVHIGRERNSRFLTVPPDAPRPPRYQEERE